jgi:hypothetical protein
MRAAAALALLTLLGGCAGVRHGSQERAAEPELPAAAWSDLPDVDTLAAKVARASVTPTERWSALILGARVGDEFVTSTWLSDPDGSETLDVYFNDWVASARARLLLDYARAMLGREKRPDYAGWPAAQAADQRSRDAADEARITRIVREGGYRDPWAPFVEAYRAFRVDALDEIAEGPPTPELSQTVTRIAERHEIPTLVAELRIEPRHVAAEMLRLVGEWRARSGGPEGKLLYACDGAVRFRVEHPLGPALLDGLQSQTQDSIRVTFHELEQEFSAWWKGHSQADQLEQDAYLRRAAEELGLVTLLEREIAARGLPPAVP